MPDRLWERMQAVTRRGVPPAPEEINDAIVCVIYQVTVGGCPVRRANLASLRISGPGRNLLLPGRKGQPGQMRIEWWETKNRKELTVELTPQAAEVVQHFVEHFRPRLMANVGSAPDNPYLFPAGGQGHRDGALLNAAFVDRNRKIGGFLLNVHVQRHLTAFVILKQDPNGDGHRPEGPGPPERKRGRRQTLRGGSLRARLNGPARVDAWRLGCRKVMADQAAGAAV